MRGVEYAFFYLFPFAVFYVGVLVRHYARFLNDRPLPPLHEQLIASLAFSLVAIAPLLPALQLTLPSEGGEGNMIAYFLILAVIIQEGLIMQEKAVRTVRELLQRETRQDENPADGEPSL